MLKTQTREEIAEEKPNLNISSSLYTDVRLALIGCSLYADSYYRSAKVISKSSEKIWGDFIKVADTYKEMTEIDLLKMFYGDISEKNMFSFLESYGKRSLKGKRVFYLEKYRGERFKRTKILFSLLKDSFFDDEAN